MKDIGSIFPLLDEDYTKIVDKVVFEKDGKLLYSLCREALAVIANQKFENNIVLLPAYTCDTVITPFLENGWQCIFYPVRKDLLIDIQEVKRLAANHTPSLILVHPYYGMDLNPQEVDLLRGLHKKGIKIVVDLTQCIFSEQHLDFVDYYVGSYRKWYKIPDGGYLKPKEPIKAVEIKENDFFVNLQADSMYLRNQYFENQNETIKQISIRLNKIAVESVDFKISPHAMSPLSLGIMQTINMEEVRNRRLENFIYLYIQLQNIQGIEFACKDSFRVTSAPLYFVIYTNDRKKLQMALAQEHIYAPVIWPVSYKEVLINSTIQNIYDTVLAIPIDQRYNEADMAKIVRTIKKFTL